MRDLESGNPSDWTEQELKQLAARSRINVISHIPGDGELAAIKAIVQGECAIAGHDELCELIERLAPHARANPRERILDLIGHCIGGSLVLGSWTITASDSDLAYFRRIRGQLVEDLRVSRLRFLGCGTACGEARSVLLRIQDILQIDVYGTKQLVTTCHFGEDGIASSAAALIVPASSLPENPSGLSWLSTDGDRMVRCLLDSLPERLGISAEDLDALIDRDRYRFQAGLLLKPDAVTVREAPGTPPVTLELFRDWRMVRVADERISFPIKDLSAWSSLFDQ